MDDGGGVDSWGGWGLAGELRGSSGAGEGEGREERGGEGKGGRGIFNFIEFKTVESV